MNTYRFKLNGALHKDVTIEARNAKEALAFLNMIITKTNFVDEKNMEKVGLDVGLVSGVDENGNLIDYNLMNEEIDDESTTVYFGILSECK